MRLDDQRESSNIENRRGEGGAGFPGGGMRFGGGGGGFIGLLLQLVVSRFGILGLVIVGGGLLLLNMFGGGGGIPLQQSTPATIGQPQSGPALSDETDRFVARVLATTEDSWGAWFAAQGQQYPAPTLVLFANSIRSACGSASSASGPFYCPADRKIYLDTSFFDELATRFGAAGDFAAAYVIAHEVGHHIQTITGLSDQVRQAQSKARAAAERNALQVRMELQADCLAGVWAAQHRDLLDAGDFAEGVRAAEAIGDDTLQRQAGGRVVPDSFTHGTSEQRVRWLSHGFQSGNPESCDTFGQGYERL